MHRTFSVPRLIGWWSLLIALTLQVGIHAASAQNPLQPAPFAPAQPSNQYAQHIELAVGMSRACQMTTRADLKRVENPNSRVVKVERIPNKNNEILLVAEHPGRTLVTFIDHNDRLEVHEVVVALGGGKDDAKKMKLLKGSQRTITLDKEPLGGAEVTAGNIVKINPTEKARVFTFEGMAPGNTRVTFFADKERKEILAVYDIEVPFVDRVTQLRDLIKKIAPTATVEVHPLLSSKEALNDKGEKVKEETFSVLLTGTVTSAEDARAIAEAAERLFPPSDLGQQTAPSGYQTVSILRNNVVNQIRIGGVHQVQLEVVVAVVNRSEARNMSFSWNVTGNNWFLSSTLGGAGGLASALTPFSPAQTTTTLTPTGNQNFSFGVLNNNSSVLGFLQMLRAEGLSKILAEPRVVTLSGRPATFLSGGETPIILPTGVGAPPSVTYKDFGTKVNFLPIVLGNGKIHLEVRSELSAIDQAAGVTIAGVVAPGFKVRSATVAVQIEDGQTLAIGGLIQNSVVASISRVPVLGDLPFLGTVFSTKSYSETEEEMIILVTPRLVDPVDCTKIPRYLPGRETRGADDFELFLEGIMEAPRGQRNVIFHPHLYKPAYHGASNAGQIPCGDGSCYGRGGAGCASGNCAPGASVSRSTGTSAPSVGTVPAGGTSNLPSVSTPTQTTPGVPATPTANFRVIVDPESPSVTTPNPSSLGMPTTPSIPMPPVRQQQDMRPVLPPVSPSPIGNR
jgi:pilus assembly protein CpaC